MKNTAAQIEQKQAQQARLKDAVILVLVSFPVINKELQLWNNC
jgi:hypothetical protein